MRIIAGSWGGRRIAAPRGRDVRPTTDRVREAWMSVLQPRLPGARVLDLFAGSGALGLECLSRGATDVVFVEQARTSLVSLRANIATLGAADRTRVIQADAMGWIRGLEPGAFDLALADPPYDRGYLGALLEVFLRTPFAAELWIEHRTSETPTEVAGLHTRRYGDTSLTRIEAPA
jgi:16S rRNA (guanine966-N2)-methyltransferase